MLNVHTLICTDHRVIDNAAPHELDFHMAHTDPLIDWNVQLTLNRALLTGRILYAMNHKIITTKMGNWNTMP
jgi:hypothetical protein